MPQPPSQVAGAQLSLSGVAAHVPSGNRGKLFEGMLVRAHNSYLARKIGKVYHIPNAWAFCPEWEWKLLAPALRARTGDGAPLKRIKTPADFIGVVRGVPVAFDAKEFAGPSIPIESNFKTHQVSSLAQWEQFGGGRAGFLVYAKRPGLIYWISAAQMVVIHSQLRAKEFARKSLNLAWLAQHALFICHTAPGQLVDWASVLAPEKST